MTRTAEYTVREYVSSDEPSWLRCRVLSFLTTAYFDDVATSKPHIEAPGFELVAISARGIVVGLMDVAVNNTEGTIETVAVHPDHQRRGVASMLLDGATGRGHALDLVALSAWTRDDSTTLRWYRAMGFTESDHYLHVFADRSSDLGEPARAVERTRPGLDLMSAFLHADLADEPQLRKQFARVHVCRRFTRTIRQTSSHRA